MLDILEMSIPKTGLPKLSSPCADSLLAPGHQELELEKPYLMPVDGIVQAVETRIQIWQVARLKDAVTA